MLLILNSNTENLTSKCYRGIIISEIAATLEHKDKRKNVIFITHILMLKNEKVLTIFINDNQKSYSRKHSH